VDEIVEHISRCWLNSIHAFHLYFKCQEMEKGSGPS